MYGGRKEALHMDAHAVEITINALLKEMRERLDKAAGIAAAAEVCSVAGNVEKGLDIALDAGQLIYEVNTLLNAASLISRLGKT